MFVDADWITELDDIKVQEPDGTRRDVTMFRHIVDDTRVCLWFGKDEYEGIHPDAPRIELLQDDKGYDIKWRVKGLENDDDDDNDDD